MWSFEVVQKTSMIFCFSRSMFKFTLVFISSVHVNYCLTFFLRMNLSNPNDTKDIITNTLSFADAIAVDWIYDHLYWIDAQHNHVMVSELDGTRRKTLIDTQVVYLRALVVYPNIG